jgi:nicotinamide-nucleotide amidase
VKPLERAAIVAVGSELLTPSKIDTNSLFITEQLNHLGIDVISKAVTGDDRAELAHVVRSVLGRVDLVVLSGGLGPTDDDVTREAVASVLGLPLAEDPDITVRLRARFVERGYPGPMPEINRRQAMVPAGARVIENPRGSAPGLWIDHEDRVVLLLPGPPRELRPMLTDLVSGPLGERSSGTPLVRRVVRVAGLIESHVDEALAPLYREWERQPIPIAATILAAFGSIELHLSARAAQAAASTFARRASADKAAGEALDAAVARIVSTLGDVVYSTDGRVLEKVVGDLLVGRGLHIGIAESCTGGLIASRLTDVPGSSRYLDRAVVVYANDAKTELLGVPEALLMEQGAVSEGVALAMAEGIRINARADVGLGVTGIAGPSGGTPEKPVGTVVIAVSTNIASTDVASTNVVSGCSRTGRTFRFHGEREHVKLQASNAALDMVRRVLTEKGSEGRRTEGRG